MSKKLMFVVNVDWFFMSHRLPIALEAMRQGYEVHIATGITDQKEAMEKLGVIVHPLALDRGKADIFQTLRTFLQMFSVFKKIKPDIVHLVTIKPVLLGGIAARLANIQGVVAAISGLGYVFLDTGPLSWIRRNTVAILYRFVFQHPNIKVIFQNTDDRNELVRLTGLNLSKAEMIRGSGVDLNIFRHEPLPQGTPIVLMASRLLADKGVREFVGAAKSLSGKARFCLVGGIDPANPSSIKAAEISKWVEQEVIEYWGQRGDMEKTLATAYIVVLPSYREGLPKILLEAAAVGRPVVTTDVPGCRDAIEADVTGLLVPPRSEFPLAEAIEDLLSDKARCVAFGNAARALAETEFNIEKVVARHLQIYNQIISRS
jgi:glycosyltransferase involved in cell wall biosynthesis